MSDSSGVFHMLPEDATDNGIEVRNRKWQHNIHRKMKDRECKNI